MNRKKSSTLVAALLCGMLAAFFATSCEQPSSSGGGGNKVSLNADEQNLVGTWEIDLANGSGHSDIQTALAAVGNVWYPTKFTATAQKRLTADGKVDNSGWQDFTNESGSWSATGSIVDLVPDSRYINSSKMPYTLNGSILTVPLGGTVKIVYNKK